MIRRTRFLSPPAVCVVLIAALAPMLLAAPGHAGTPRCFGEKATIVVDGGYVVGTPRADVIVTTDPSAEVHGLGGDDRICGAFLAYGGAGDDRIFYKGGAGTEFELTGGPGDDRIFVTADQYGNIEGGPGADRLASRRGEQWISGGRGDDIITGGAGPDVLIGGPGDDVARGNAGHDRVYGHGGDDRLYGGTGNDQLSGDRGSGDAGFGGPGRDTCDASTERAVNCRR